LTEKEKYFKGLSRLQAELRDMPDKPGYLEVSRHRKTQNGGTIY
jgi:hypothetical protein